MLKGVEGDNNNPRLLTDEQVIEFINQIPQARASLYRILPTLLLAEQDRINYLLSGSPGLLPLTLDTISDNFQHRMNTPRLQRGGGWFPPPPRG